MRQKLKLLFLLWLIPLIGMAQVSTGSETDFDYGLRNLAPQTVTTPTYLCTQGMDGTIGIIPSAYIEKTANKQDNLNYDGTGVKYPTVDGVNDWATLMATVATKTGLLSKNDTFNLTPLTNSTLRIAPVTSAMFWNEIFVPSTAPISAIKSFPQKDYDLTQLVTATGGNVNTNPITTDGKHVRYLAYDKNGNVYSSATNFISNNTLLQLGFVTVLKTGATVEFIDGTAGPRNVLAQPALASNTAFDKVASTITSVSVGRKSNASFSTSNGTITGISVNWKSPANPTNSDPIDVFNYTGQTTAAFVAIDPTFLTSTSAITTHTLLTELDGGIPVNESFYNTTTGLRGTMANGSAGVARIMVGVRGGIFWQMGEFASTACYADLATAKSNIYSHVFSDAIVPPGVAYEIARVAFTKGVTVTNNDTQFYLVNTGGGSGGSSTIPPVSDATTATKGIIKLAGDLGGTADLPTVPTKQNVLVSGVNIKTVNGETLLGSGDIQAGSRLETVRTVIPQGHTSTTIAYNGYAALSLVGTAQAQPVDSGVGRIGKMLRTSAKSATTAGSSAGWTNASVYMINNHIDSAWETEFYFCDSSPVNIPDKRLFVGYKQIIGAIGNVDPSALTSLYGMGCDGADTNYQIYYSGGGGSPTKIDLGASFNKNTVSTDYFYFKMTKVSGSRTVTYTVKNIINGVSTTGTFTYTSGVDSFIGLDQVHINNNTTAAEARITISEIKTKTIY